MRSRYCWLHTSFHCFPLHLKLKCLTLPIRVKLSISLYWSQPVTLLSHPSHSSFCSLNTTSLFPTQRLCGPYSLCQKSLSPDLCMAESFFSFRIQLKVAPLVMPSTIRQTPIEEQSESQLTWALQKCQCHERKIKAGTSLH